MSKVCLQLMKQPDGSSCNHNNLCKYPECLVEIDVEFIRPEQIEKERNSNYKYFKLDDDE